ncbi:cytochrome c-type biogenesis protein [Candidatus Nitrosacidococcus tergens]|uniref:Cytochrome c-type biogenesis protein n=1 Tax=Candidatus Nitrosacidococcus tergens TaxID=553981 RepID=A0A7G1QAG5_9GAMM|nr:cytochrome c-type biogenesis protein [Candidatus Nitrosacidococcus tergens]CAB1276525.1 Cytochrome c-type biogenesis protein CcmH [Candidatus Nitrosacidococcus tergens]
MIRILFFIFTLVGINHLIFAATDLGAYDFKSPEQELRFRELTSELRCLVCQNQSLADSHADLAGDMRREVYQQMVKGLSDQEIVDFLVDRYGDFVLFRPPVQWNTYLLWFGPGLLFLFGFGVFIVTMRKRNQMLTPTLSDSEHQRMAKILEDED